MSKKKITFSTKLLWYLALGNGIVLLSCFSALFIDPRTWVFPQFLGLFFPYVFIFNLLILIYWISNLNSKFILPLILLISSFWGVSKYIQFNYTEKPQKTEKLISVGSLNAQLFGHWQGREFIDTTLESVRHQNLDILCMQEAYITGKNKDSLLNNMLVNTLFNDYKYSKLVEAKPFGMLIFSKYNIINAWPIEIPGKTANMMVAYDLQINNDTIRVINAHLQSIRFNEKQYAFLEGKETNSKLDKTKNIYNQLSEAYKMRAAQAEVLFAAMQESKHPVIVCADLNDIPMSFVYNKVLGNDFRDAFRESGNGLETSYRGRLPNFRIDYILYSKSIRAISYKSSSEIPSDHKLIMAKLELP